MRSPDEDPAPLKEKQSGNKKPRHRKMDQAWLQAPLGYPTARRLLLDRFAFRRRRQGILYRNTEVFVNPLSKLFS